MGFGTCNSLIHQIACREVKVTSETVENQTSRVAEIILIDKSRQMNRDTSNDPSRRGLRSVGLVALVLGLPLALLAALHPPTEYEATLGIDALDCQGPFETYLFAAPALLIYGMGLVINGVRWRYRMNAILTLLCLAICVAVAANVFGAIAEDREQANAFAE